MKRNVAGVRPAPPPPATVRLGARIAWAAIIIAAVAVICAALAYAGFVPLPRSIASIAAAQSIGRGQALVVGMYEMQPFVANGNGLPPYALTDSHGAKIRVSPALGDLRPVRVVALLDLATGDGSQWSPYAIHTLGSVPIVAAGAGVVALVVAGVVFWLAGLIAFALRPRAARRVPRPT